MTHETNKNTFNSSPLNGGLEFLNYTLNRPSVLKIFFSFFKFRYYVLYLDTPSKVP